MVSGAQREGPGQSHRNSYSHSSNDTGDWDFFAFKQAFSEKNDTPPPIKMFRQANGTPTGVSRWDSIVAAVLAFTLGTFGVHWFFLGNRRRAFFYLIFFWTGIPTILGIIDGIMLLCGTGRDGYYSTQ